MTPKEYVEKLTRLDALMGINSEEISEAEHAELCELSDELRDYEEETFPNLYPHAEDDEQ